MHKLYSQIECLALQKIAESLGFLDISILIRWLGLFETSCFFLCEKQLHQILQNEKNKVDSSANLASRARIFQLLRRIDGEVKKLSVYDIRANHLITTLTYAQQFSS